MTDMPIAPYMAAHKLNGHYYNDVPYKSQEDTDARGFRNDCGPACVAMLDAYYFQRKVRVDDLSRQTSLAGNDSGLSVEQVAQLLTKQGLTARIAVNPSVDQLRAELKAGRPPILLIRYGDIPKRENIHDTSGHFVILTGIDEPQATVNDPDWYGAEMAQGKDFPVALADLMRAIASSPDAGKVIFTALHAQVPEVMTVATDTLHVRSLADYKQSQVIKPDLLRGQTIVVQGAQKDPTQPWTWAALISVDGQPRTGYVARELLQVPHAVTLTTRAAMAIRDAPNGNRVGVVGAGVQVSFTGTRTALAGYVWGQTFDGWIAIKSTDGLSTFCTESTPPTKMGFHYGLHLHLGTDGNAVRDMARSVFTQTGNRLGFTVINDVGLANDLAQYGFVVMRRQDGNGDVNPSIPDGTTYDQAVQIGVDFVCSRWNFMYEMARVDALVFQNEPGYHPMDYAVNIGIMQECDRRGHKAAIFAYAVGNPSGDDWSAKYDTLMPALTYAAQHGHFVALHEYGTGEDKQAPASAVQSQEWYSLRHRKMYDKLEPANRPKLLILETGNFAATFMGTQATLDDMRDYNALLDADGYVHKFMYWTLGGRGCGWAQSSMDGSEQNLKEFFLKA